MPERSFSDQVRITSLGFQAVPVTLLYDAVGQPNIVIRAAFDTADASNLLTVQESDTDQPGDATALQTTCVEGDTEYTVEVETNKRYLFVSAVGAGNVLIDLYGYRTKNVPVTQVVAIAEQGCTPEV